MDGTVPSAGFEGSEWNRRRATFVFRLLSEPFRRKSRLRFSLPLTPIAPPQAPPSNPSPLLAKRYMDDSLRRLSNNILEN
ncbi:hypothetical protein BHE74_00026852 [Ensete ventricosum]|nr:hypothetical protein GW17_00035091 [Ensete ventricosum]RWW65821.1 hypothetical protein BHE74_00026852 [Ensete ventricosum]